MEDVNVIALLLMFLIGLVMLFAQLRLFSIDKTLKEIRVTCALVMVRPCRMCLNALRSRNSDCKTGGWSDRGRQIWFSMALMCTATQRLSN